MRQLVQLVGCAVLYIVPNVMVMATFLGDMNTEVVQASRSVHTDHIREKEQGFANVEKSVLRVIDNEGEDYLYPAKYFVMVEFEPTVKRTILQAA